MRQYLCVILFALLVTGCKKEAPVAAPSSSTELLTATAWLFGEYYSGYGTANQKRVYKRGQNGNVVDLSDYRYLFKKDGNFELVLGRETIYGSWKFSADESQVEISSDGGTPTLLTIAVLSRDTFAWGKDGYFALMVRP